jgi:hypothetical protein
MTNLQATETKKITHNQKVKVISSCDYGNYVVGLTGIIVKIFEDGVNVWLPVFPTLPYNEQIFYFPFDAIK